MAVDIFNSSGTWTCPSGVTSVTVECFGAGGDGGASLNKGGGSGGDYAKKTAFTTVPGNNYSVTIGGANQSTYFDDGSLVYALAGLTPGFFGDGGTTTGDVTHTGGGSGSASGKGNIGGGGGGAGASDNANGGNGGANSGTTGGTGAGTTSGTTYNGGAGGNGGTYNTVQATNGTAPGGGGGGAYTGGTAGTGGAGKVVITYSSGSYTQDGSGKLTFNGIATEQTSGTYTPLGTLTFNGLATAFIPSNTMFFMGLASCRASYIYLASGSLRFKNPTATILYANGDGTIGSWTNEIPNTTNLYLSVDEGTGSVNDADYIQTSTTSDTITFQLTNTPSDFASAIGIIISVRHVVTSSKGTPMYVSEIQIVESDNTTAITATASATADTTLTTYRYSPAITGTNTKTSWDNARIRLKSRSTGTDTPRVTALQVQLDYIPADPSEFSQNASGALLFNGIAGVTNTYIYLAFGKLTFNGIASQFVSGGYVAEGSLLFNGLASVTNTHTYLPSGYLTFNGISTPTVSENYLASGQLLFSGLCSTSNSYVYLASGRLTLSGIQVDYVTLNADTQPVLYTYDGYNAPDGTLTNVFFHAPEIGAGNYGGSYGSDLIGVFEITNKNLYCIGNTSFSPFNIAVIYNTTRSKVHCIGDFVIGSNLTIGIACNYQDNSNYWLGEVSGSAIYIFEVVGLTYTQRATTSIATPSIGDAFKLEMYANGDEVIFVANGLSISYSVAGRNFASVDAHGPFIYDHLDGAYIKEFSIYAPTVEGQTLALSGTTSSQVSENYLAGGQLTFSGIASTTVSAIVNGLGKLTFSGIADAINIIIVEGTGALTFSGLASCQVSVNYLASGQLTFNGIAGTQVSEITTGSGSLILSGIASMSIGYVVNGSGSLLFNGLASSQVTGIISAIGKLTFNGLASYSCSYNGYQASGKLRFNVGYISDSFTDVNGTSLTAHTPEWGGGYDVYDGVVEVSSNAAKLTSATGTFTHAVASVSSSDMVVEADLLPAATGDFGIVANFQDNNNSWWLWTRSDGTHIFEYNAGTPTVRASYLTPVNATHMKLVATGDTITGYATISSIVQVISYTTPNRPFKSNNKAGMVFYTASTSSIDNLTAIPFAESFSPTTSANIIPLGTLILNGIASCQDSVIYLSSGKLIFDGIASYQSSVSYLASGSLLFDGLAFCTTATMYEFIGTGGLIADGIATQAVSVILDAAGKLRLTGFQPISHYLYEASGRLLIFDPRLFLWWKLEDGTGSTVANDSSAYANQGQLMGLDVNADWVPGNPILNFGNNYALIFDGTDQYVTCDLNELSDLDDGFSLSVWVNLDLLPA